MKMPNCPLLNQVRQIWERYLKLHCFSLGLNISCLMHTVLYLWFLSLKWHTVCWVWHWTLLIRLTVPVLSPVSTSRVDGPSWRVTGFHGFVTRQHGLSTRPINSASGNRALLCVVRAIQMAWWRWRWWWWWWWWWWCLLLLTLTYMCLLQSAFSSAVMAIGIILRIQRIPRHFQSRAPHFEICCHTIVYCSFLCCCTTLQEHFNLLASLCISGIPILMPLM